jgi:hypothetical protein
MIWKTSGSWGMYTHKHIYIIQEGQHLVLKTFHEAFYHIYRACRYIQVNIYLVYVYLLHLHIRRPGRKKKKRKEKPIKTLYKLYNICSYFTNIRSYGRIIYWLVKNTCAIYIRRRRDGRLYILEVYRCDVYIQHCCCCWAISRSTWWHYSIRSRALYMYPRRIIKVARSTRARQPVGSSLIHGHLRPSLLKDICTDKKINKKKIKNKKNKYISVNIRLLRILWWMAWNISHFKQSA